MERQNHCLTLGNCPGDVPIPYERISSIVTLQVVASIYEHVDLDVFRYIHMVLGAGRLFVGKACRLRGAVRQSHVDFTSKSPCRLV